MAYVSIVTHALRKEIAVSPVAHVTNVSTLASEGLMSFKQAFKKEWEDMRGELLFIIICVIVFGVIWLLFYAWLLSQGV